MDTNQGLKNVQWTYLGVACFVALLIILFYLAPMPEITDADMGTQEFEIAEYDPGPFRKQYNLFLAVWSQVHTRSTLTPILQESLELQTFKTSTDSIY